MSEHSQHIEVRPGSERSFGFTFAAIFLVLGFMPLLSGGAVRWWLVALAIVFAALTAFAPHLFNIPNRLWFKFGMALGAIIAPVVMALVYLFAFVPMGFIARLLGKDLLGSRIDKGAPSYWQARTEQMQSMKNQF